MKIRIVERAEIDGSISYVIQKNVGLFFKNWCDAGNTWPMKQRDSFKTYEEAMNNISEFDGSKPTDKQIFIKEC